MYHTVKPHILLIATALLGLLPATGAMAAIFNVTKTADTADGECTPGDCSLREAIIAANASPDGQNTISVLAGTYTLNRTGSGEDDGATGDLDITNHATISGAGEGVTIIDGLSTDRVMHIHSANNFDEVTVTVSDLTLQGGTVDAASGGCLYIDSLSSVELSNVTVTNCTTTNAGQIAGEAMGGGIYNAGTLTMLSGTLSENTANINQANGQANYGGGGLFNAETGTATLRGTTVRKNSVNSSGRFATGGGILNLGTLTVRENSLGVGSTIGGSDRALDANTAHSGGGISNVGGVLAISNTTIKNNTTLSTALVNPDPRLDGGHTGGGIYNNNTSTNRGNAIISASTIDSNYADRLGGGLFTAGVPIAVSHSTISNNQARFVGAGIANQGNTPAEITNSTIAFNISRDDVGGSTDTRGGGISTTGRMTVTSATIAGNYAAAGQQIYVQDNAASGTTAPQLLITNTIVAHDTTVLGAGLESSAALNCGQGLSDGNNTVTPETVDTIVSRSFNLESGNTCNFDTTSFSDKVDTDPLFIAGGLRTDLGGPTPILPIADGSPATERRDISGCPSRDQRYYVRKKLCDNGAYEADAEEGAQTLADIKITITESDDPVFVANGAQLVYTLTITNISRDDAIGVILSDGALTGSGAQSIESARVVVGSGSCDTVGAEFGCNLGTLAGLSTTKISVTVIPTADGSITVSASVYPSDRATDPFHGNNTASETTTVSPGTGSSPIQGEFGSGGGALHWAALLLLALVPALRRFN